ncbi:PAS domain S-box protein [Flavobacterium ginsenosidimutans]|uniref:PAS domain S-box protein n=1 Tax=Flavobacterium ginsenosidimutans TaxID=687844 RepID=UPI000DAF15CA|nr:PAS domain S-box protein [Flavobacterium ginsenosidimutans]KAF2328766.1 PAS domain S-box protein [Flavobacterium ginsenosidimutans]
MNRKKKEHYFLSEGGEMGSLIRSADWSKTPLGDPEKWPQSLKTMTAMMLGNPFGMYIAWGKNYTQLYNDAFRPILGASKHPEALGGSSRNTFAEIWETIGPMFANVMQGQAVSLPDFKVSLHRNGYIEDCFFDFSYSPIKIEDGSVGGILVTVIETTEKKIVADALKESNARFVNNIMQAPIAMCIFRGENHIVEIANDQMLQLWETKAENVINKSIFEVLPGLKKQGFDEILHSVFTDGKKIKTDELFVQLNRNGKTENTYINFVYEALREPDGTISGVAAIATEVTAQVLARSKVEESEQKIRQLVENAPFPIAVYVGKEMRIELANDSIIKVWGKGPDVIGKTYTEILPELKDEPIFKQVETVYKTGQSFHSKNTRIDLVVDNVLKTSYFNYSFTPLYDLNGKIYGVMNTAVDITDLFLAKQKIEESDKRFRNTVRQAPVGITILRGPEYIVEMANEAYLKLVDREEKTFIGRSLYDSLPEVKETVSAFLDGVLKTGIPFHGIEVPVPLNRYGKIETSYFDFLYHPLKEENGAISGILVTVTEVSEKVEARKKIELNEERLRIVVEASELGTWELNVKTRIPTYSQRYLEIIGGYTEYVLLTHEELLAHLHPDDVHIRNKGFKEALRSGLLNYEVRVIWKDQSIHWIEGKGKVFYDENHQPEKLIGTIRDITKEKKYQQKIEESEKKLRNLIMQSPVPKAILRGNDFVIEMANFALLKNIWKKEESEVQGKKILELFPELNKQKYAKLLKKVYESGKVYSESESLLFIDNEKGRNQFYVDFEFAPLRESDNSISGLRMTLIDVTEKVEARKKIEESEKRFRSLTESIPQLIWETDAEGNALFTSGKWMEYTGIEPGIEGSWQKMIHPDDFEENVKIWQHALATGEMYRCDVRMHRKDGSYRWHTVIGEPVFGPDNKIIKWVGAFTDIHTEKAFTHELEQQVTARTRELIQMNESLRKSEERYHLMVEEVQEYAILYLNAYGIIENWNAGAEKIKGYKAEEVIGKYFSIFYTKEDQQKKLPEKLLQLAIENGKVVHEGWRSRKDGSKFWASVVITAIHNKQNEIIGFSKVTHDLTERKKADDKLKMNALELEQKNNELEEMNKELQSFAYISSHDLQEPLRKIQTFASQIIEKESENLSENGKDKFKRMQNAAQRMQTLINDLLAYSRTNAHERTFIKTDLSQIIEEVKEDLTEELEQKNAIIEIKQTCHVDIIPFQFKQLLYNLISNSLKFSNPEIPIVIKIESKTELGKDLENEKLIPAKKYCHVKVSDNGIGFEAQYNKKIFEVFQRLHGRDRYNGTGIGLAIVKKIVENHNGIITASGIQNEGAAFDIYIPVN